jgi:phosphoribosylformimino-5-aminoimidazole carboxamide ribotide isomerase
MQLYPAIDLRAGRVVRLLQGDFAQETRYPDDAVELAKRYQDEGATWLHVVDLDGARGDQPAATENLKRIEAIARATTLRIQTGGGVRTEADVRLRINVGAARVVIGSVAVKNPDVVIAWRELFGAQQLCLALDARADSSGDYYVHTAGWVEAAHVELFECVARFAAAGFAHALVTDIALDGMLAGPNVSLYARLKALVQTTGMPEMRPQEMHIQASGGVAQISDLQALKGHSISGVIIGKALLEGKFTLRAAFAAVKP